MRVVYEMRLSSLPVAIAVKISGCCLIDRFVFVKLSTITGKPFRVRVLPERVEFVSSSVIVIIPLLIVNITL